MELLVIIAVAFLGIVALAGGAVAPPASKLSRKRPAASGQRLDKWAEKEKRAYWDSCR